MTDELIWRDVQRGDRRALEAFACARPRSRVVGVSYPLDLTPWETEAQSLLRKAPTKPQPDSLVLVAVQGTAVKAASYASRITPAREEWNVAEGTARVNAEYKIHAAAVELDARGLGGSMADELMRRTLRRIGEDAEQRGYRMVTVIGYVDRRNVPSARWMSRSNFTNLGDVGKGNNEWAIALLVRP